MVELQLSLKDKTPSRSYGINVWVLSLEDNIHFLLIQITFIYVSFLYFSPISNFLVNYFIIQGVFLIYPFFNDSYINDSLFINLFIDDFLIGEILTSFRKCCYNCKFAKQKCKWVLLLLCKFSSVDIRIKLQFAFLFLFLPESRSLTFFHFVFHFQNKFYLNF